MIAIEQNHLNYSCEYNIIRDINIVHRQNAIKSDIMKIAKFVPENEILQEIANRLAKSRKAQGYTQTEFADKAGIGVATLRRIEGGKDGQFETWLKILKALDRAPAIDALLPEQFISSKADSLAGKSRQHKKRPFSSPMVWED